MLTLAESELIEEYVALLLSAHYNPEIESDQKIKLVDLANRSKFQYLEEKHYNFKIKP